LILHIGEKQQLVMSDTRQSHSWRLVWLYEHSFKPENCDEVAQLSKLADQFGGSFCCVKHASKLAATLLQRKCRIPFVLMTDFRGLAPCMTILASNALPDPPLHMIVLCQQDRQVVKAMARASQWVTPWMQNQMFFEATLKSATSALEDLMKTRVWSFGVPMTTEALPAPCNSKTWKCYLPCETSAKAKGMQQESTITLFDQGQHVDNLLPWLTVANSRSNQTSESLCVAQDGLGVALVGLFAAQAALSVAQECLAVAQAAQAGLRG